MTRQPHTAVLFHLSDSSCKSGLVWIFPKSQIASKVGFKSRHPPWFENHFGNDDFVITTLRQIQISQDTLARIIVQAKNYKVWRLCPHFSRQFAAPLLVCIHFLFPSLSLTTTSRFTIW